MYDKGGVLNKKYFITRRWMENNQEARTEGRRQKFWKRNIYTLIVISIKEQCWRVFKLNFDFCHSWYYLRYKYVLFVQTKVMKNLALYIFQKF